MGPYYAIGKMNIWVVIPVFNEEQTIRHVITDVYQYSKKIIVINDGSSDSSRQILTQLPVILINNAVNMGYVPSLEKGIRHAFNEGADYVITFDSDEQHKGSDLLKFIVVINRVQPDFVLGKRSRKNRAMELFFSLYAKKRFGFSDPLCGMKAIKKGIFERYGYLEQRYTIGTQLVFDALKDGATFREIQLSTKARKDHSRFGSMLYGNWLELKALFHVVSGV